MRARRASSASAIIRPSQERPGSGLADAGRRAGNDGNPAVAVLSTHRDVSFTWNDSAPFYPSQPRVQTTALKSSRQHPIIKDNTLSPARAPASDIDKGQPTWSRPGHRKTAIKEMSMSLVINTNIEAMDAHRNLVNTENAMSKSMQRLSSGLRINSAADDAAGLAISESLTGQVNGLDQAQRNAQDGVSLVQTADGTLNEVQPMLQRVRELAVQYQNGTLSTERPERDHLRGRPAASEIARIGTTAQFNGIELFTRRRDDHLPGRRQRRRGDRRLDACDGHAWSAAITLGTTTTLSTIDG